MSALKVSTVALLILGSDACEWDNDGYVNTLIGGSIGGIVLGVIVVVLVSLPLCCGVLKQYGKVIAGIGIGMGVVALVVPYLTTLGSCAAFVDDLCTTCACTTGEKEGILHSCNVLGFFVIYLGAYGWAACVLGIVGMSLACCVCCQCCNAKLDTPGVPQQAVGQQVVVVGKEVGSNPA